MKRLKAEGAEINRDHDRDLDRDRLSVKKKDSRKARQECKDMDTKKPQRPQREERTLAKIAKQRKELTEGGHSCPPSVNFCSGKAGNLSVLGDLGESPFFFRSRSRSRFFLLSLAEGKRGQTQNVNIVLWFHLNG